MEFKASFFFNEMEGDIIGFESAKNMFEESLYRIVESAEQLRNVYALLFQNLSQIEAQCDLKNVFEMCHIVLSFRIKESEINFISFPVFTKHFKLSEPYSNWIQFKSTVKNGDNRGQSTSAISTFFKQAFPGTRLCFLLFVESSPEKYPQSSLVLEEVSRLITDLKSGAGNGTPNERVDRERVNTSNGGIHGEAGRRQSDSMHNSRHHPASDHSSQLNDELDQYAKQVIQEVNDFILKSEELFVISLLTIGQQQLSR